MAKKLTKAQQLMLEQLATGDLIQAYLTTYIWCFTTQRANGLTLKALRKNGWIEEVPAPPGFEAVGNKSVFVHWMGISNAGRAALAPSAPDAAAGKECPHCGFDTPIEENGKLFCENCGYVIRDAKPTVTPALAPTVEHRVKLPTLAVAPAPEPPPAPAITYGVLGNPSLDTIIAHLIDALEWELSGAEDAGQLTLRRHITDAIVETERLLQAQGLPPMWACVLDLLAGPQGWQQWQEQVAAWTMDGPVELFLDVWYMEHPDLDASAEVEVPPLPAVWYGSTFAVLRETLEDAFWNATPDTVQAPQAAAAAPAALELPPAVNDAPATPLKPSNGQPAAELVPHAPRPGTKKALEQAGVLHKFIRRRDAYEAVNEFQEKHGRKPDVLCLLPKYRVRISAFHNANILGVAVVYEDAMPDGFVWAGDLPGQAAA